MSSKRSPSDPGRPAGLPLPVAERRRRRREWRIAAGVAGCLVLLGVFEQKVLAIARSLPIGSDVVFLALVHVSVIGIGLLVFLLARNFAKLFVERRRGLFGSKLNTKYVISFVFSAALSTTALFVLSAYLVTHAVNTWFKAELSQGLTESLEVANAYYRNAEDGALAFARQIAHQIEQQHLLREQALPDLRRFVSEKQREYGLGIVEVFSAQLEVLATATHPDIAVVALESPDSDLIHTGLSGVERTVVQDAGPGQLIRGVVPVHSTFKAKDIVGVVVVNVFIPRALGRRVDVIQAALEAYRRLQPSEGTFQTSMLLLLAMITLVSLLFSSWMGFRLAKQVTDPIQRLAGAVEQVAAGNLEVRVEPRGEDEIGHLVAGFNRMASDLQASREDLERRRALMEIILSGVVAGVVSLDRDGAVTTINPSALRLLGVPRGAWLQRKPSEILSGRALDAVEELLQGLSAGGQETLRRQVPISVGDELRVLNWTVSRLRDAEGGSAGCVIVIDDVTQILKAQRMAAWRDVARRIAHEIKNPLTPIQLSAQRLRRKLGPRLADAEAERVLVQCTDAITSQVDAMKLLLSEFSNFARLPATDPAPTALNEIVEETVAMYRGNQSVEFSTDLDEKLPSLDLDREQIKRVIVNLVDNALGAIESAGPGPRRVELSTRSDQAVGTVHLEIADTGTGIRVEDRSRLFQPGFSTKADGTGIGLAIVSRIVSDHSGYIRVRSNQPRGARFIIELPVRT